MPLEAGDLVLYCGRQAEVLCVGGWRNPYVVEVIDEAGLAHDYTVTQRSELQELVKENETVLDAIAKLTSVELSPYAQCVRLAEQWAAAPQAGDVFRITWGGARRHLLRLTEVWGDGVIVGYYEEFRTGKQQVVSWDNDRVFRKFFKNQLTPVYNLAAYATRRPELRNNPLLHRG